MSAPAHRRPFPEQRPDQDHNNTPPRPKSAQRRAGRLWPAIAQQSCARARWHLLRSLPLPSHLYGPAHQSGVCALHLPDHRPLLARPVNQFPACLAGDLTDRSNPDAHSLPALQSVPAFRYARAQAALAPPGNLPRMSRRVLLQARPCGPTAQPRSTSHCSPPPVAHAYRSFPGAPTPPFV